MEQKKNTRLHTTEGGTTRTQQHDARTMRADDVHALVALVEKLEMCRRSSTTTRRREGNDLIHATIRDGEDENEFMRRGQNLLTHAREYLTAVTALECVERRAFHEGRHGADRVGGFGAKDDGADRRFKQMETRRHDMTTPSPLSPPSESVLTGVLRRENASLIAKIRRLEEEAKRTDDKSAWGEEHLVRRLKAVETQCAEVIADKTRLEIQCADALAEKDRLAVERDEAVAAKGRLEMQNANIINEKDRFKSQCRDAIAANRRLELERDGAVAAKDVLEMQRVEAVAEKSRLEINYAKAVADKVRLEVQCVEAAAEKTRLEMQCEQAAAAKDLLKIQSAEATTENDHLRTQCAETFAERDLLKSQGADAFAEKDHLETERAAATGEKNCLQVELAEVVAEKNLLKIQCAEAVAEKNHLGNQHAEAVAEKDRLEDECATERALVDELRATIADLQSQLIDSERALSEAKEAVAAMETQLTRAKRSDTMETSGTDSDDSEVPTRLSLRVRAIEDGGELRPEIDTDTKRPGRSRTRSGDSFASHTSDASARRRSTMRGRSSMGSSTDSRKSQPSTPLDPVRPCSRSRCAQVNQLASPSKGETFRLPLRASFHQVGSPAPSCASIDDPSEATGRCRTSSAHHTRVTSDQPNEPRPRWRW